MADPLSITTSVLSLVGVVLKVSMMDIGMVDKTTVAHETARDALRNLRRALQNLNKGTSNIQAILRILILDPKDKAVKKLMALPEGEVAVKELCESLESTRGLLAERAGQAQLETTGLEPLPLDRRSLAFVQAVFKHNFSPSDIEDAIIALKDFQFEVESCQQTTELAFQQVWRVYDIVKSRALQRRPAISTISSISIQIPESSTEPNAATSFRREIINWLKRQDVASKSNFETPNSAAQTGRAGTSAEENTFVPESQLFPTSRDQDSSKNRIRNFFGLSRARQDYKKPEPEADEDFKIIEPFLWTPPQPFSPQATKQPVYSDRDLVSKQQPRLNTTIYGQQFQPPATQNFRQDAVHQTTHAEDRTEIDDFSARLKACTEKGAASMSQLQAQPPIPEVETPSAPFLRPGAAQAVTHGASSLDRYTSQPWPNRQSPADPIKLSPSPINHFGPPPSTHDPSVGTSTQYDNDRSGVEGHDDDSDGSISSEEHGMSWVRGFFGISKEREREKDALNELARMVGFLVAMASDDWTLVLELCERASASEGAAREAAKTLRIHFKYGDPPTQLNAARLWAIMIHNSSNFFTVHTAGKKFMETVEFVIQHRTTSPVVRERFIDVLAGAAFTFRDPGMEGFQSTWKRVRPPNKPEDGIPFDMEDSMFDPTQGNRLRTLTSPAPQAICVNTHHSPQVHRPNSRRQDSDQGPGGLQQRGHGDREPPRPPRQGDRRLIPPEEDMRRLFEECDLALFRSRVLNEALAYATSESFRENPIIKEYYGECQVSYVMISAQIPWASSGAARSQAKREETPGGSDITAEEELLAALLGANQDLVDVLKCYDDLEAAARAEQETGGHERGRAEQKPEAKYTSPEGVPIPDPARSGTSTSSREPLPSPGGGRPSKSRELPPSPSAPATAAPNTPPPAYTTLIQPPYYHHHSRSNTNVNESIPPPPAIHGPRLAATHPRSQTPSLERQVVFTPHAPQVLPTAAVNAATVVGLPTSSPTPSEPQYPIRHAPPLGPPPS